MEKYVDMKSPLTGGKVKEVSTTEVKEFRKEKFRVHVRYYICEDTGEQFTTTEQDSLQFNDLYSQYRIRHGIPFPDEIKGNQNPLRVELFPDYKDSWFWCEPIRQI